LGRATVGDTVVVGATVGAVFGASFTVGAVLGEIGSAGAIDGVSGAVTCAKAVPLANSNSATAVAGNGFVDTYTCYLHLDWIRGP
jgi:hypothetical protein